MGLSPNVETWRRTGRMIEAEGHEVFIVEMGEGPVVFLLHGFPASSYEWRGVMMDLARRGMRAVSFDFLGHGFTAKPADVRYSLFEQANLAEAVAKIAGIERCVLVAHDMGDTVAAELLSRLSEGTLGFAVERCILTNGSIFMHLVQLSPGQQALLALPDEALAESLPLDGFKPGLSATFSAQHQASDDELDAMLELIRFNDGDRVLPRVIRYIEDRRQHQERWTAGFLDYPGTITAFWGAQDPIAVVAMAHHLKELRPETEVTVWDDCGHWPSIEEPGRLAEAIARRVLG